MVFFSMAILVVPYDPFLCSVFSSVRALRMVASGVLGENLY